MENSNNSNVNISLKSQWTLNNYLLTFVVGWIRLCSKGWARLRWYIKFVVLPVLAGTTVLHNLQTTLVWLRSDLYYPKNCHTGELTFPLLFTISSFAAALVFCLWKGIQQTSTRQRYGATKRDTVTWLAVSVSLPTLLGYQRASAFVNATKLASQPLFSSDEEYKISNVLSNTFFIDIDHVSIAIHIVIVLSPSPTMHRFFLPPLVNHVLHLHFTFSRRFYPKWLTVHSGYTCFVSMCVPWESNPQPLRC